MPLLLENYKIQSQIVLKYPSFSTTRVGLQVRTVYTCKYTTYLEPFKLITMHHDRTWWHSSGSAQLKGCRIIFIEKSSRDVWLQLLFASQLELLLRLFHVCWHCGTPETEHTYTFGTWDSNSFCQTNSNSLCYQATGLAWSVELQKLCVLAYAEYANSKDWGIRMLIWMLILRWPVFFWEVPCTQNLTLNFKRPIQKLRGKKKTSEKCFCLIAIFILHIFNAGDLCNMQSHLFLYNI